MVRSTFRASARTYEESSAQAPCRARLSFFHALQRACRALHVPPALLRIDAPRRRAAALTGRRSAEARAPLRHGVPPPARVTGALVCSLLHAACTWRWQIGGMPCMQGG